MSPRLVSSSLPNVLRHSKETKRDEPPVVLKTIPVVSMQALIWALQVVTQGLGMAAVLLSLFPLLSL